MVEAAGDTRSNVASIEAQCRCSAASNAVQKPYPVLVAAIANPPMTHIRFMSPSRSRASVVAEGAKIWWVCGRVALGTVPGSNVADMAHRQYGPEQIAPRLSPERPPPPPRVVFAVVRGVAALAERREVAAGVIWRIVI